MFLPDESGQVPNHTSSQFWSHGSAPTVSKSSEDTSLSVEEVPTTSNVTSFPSNSTATPTIANESQHETLSEVFRPTIVLFPGDLLPREIFASENEVAIRQKMDELRGAKSDLGLNAEGMHNKVLEELWEKADKNMWQSKIDSLAKDVDAYVQLPPSGSSLLILFFRNQEQFPTSMLHALQDLCSRERLGTTLMSFTWAFRDSKTDKIKGGQ